MTATIPALLQPLKDRLAAQKTPGVEREDLARHLKDAESISTSFQHNLSYHRDTANYLTALGYQKRANAPTDQAKLIAAVEAMESLAAAWESRGERMQESAQGAPEDVQESLYDQGEDMIWSASQIRTALTQALGGDGA